MPWGACRYRPKPLLWNSTVLIFQTIRSDIILILIISSNIQQQYPKLLLFFGFVSTLHQLIWWKDVQSSTCNCSPSAISQSLNPTGWEQTREFLQTEKREGNNLPRATKNFSDRAQSRAQLSHHQHFLGTWVLYFVLGAASTSEAHCKFTGGISTLQTMINCSPSKHCIRTINYLDYWCICARMGQHIVLQLEALWDCQELTNPTRPRDSPTSNHWVQVLTFVFLCPILGRE